QQLGTGHAVAQALPGVDPNAYVLVLYGDVPLISKKTLDAALAHAGEGVAIVTAHATRAGRLGRIVRGKTNAIERIVEAVDATPMELAIDEINSGILCARARLLGTLLAAVEPRNAQGEFYLTDVVALAVARGVPVRGVCAASEIEVSGVNDRA